MNICRTQFNSLVELANRKVAGAALGVALLGLASSAQAALLPPTLSQASRPFNATFTLTITQGSVDADFKEFRYTKTTTTTPAVAPANCTSGTAVPVNGTISIAV